MEFVVNFRGRHREKMPEYPYRSAFAVGVDAVTLGMDDLDRIRSVLKIPKLNPKNVEEGVHNLYTNPDIKLSAHIAQESEHFKGGCSVTVKVCTHMLNRFVRTRIETLRDPENGAVKNVRLFFELDESLRIENH